MSNRLISSAYENIITPKKSKRDKAAAKNKKTFVSREEKLAHQLEFEQTRLIRILNEINGLGLLEVRVLDAPNSQWVAPFDGHEWDLKNEEYRVKGTD